VTVRDTTAPSLVAPVDVTAEATGTITPVSIGQATATDIFGVTITNNAPLDSTYPPGETLVTWTATDANGNAATGTQRVTVHDTIAPVLTVPADVITEATGTMTSVSIGQATATDIFNVTITNNAPLDGTYPLGNTLVTWTVLDVNGNGSTATQKVTVVDTTKPTISITGVADSTTYIETVTPMITITDQASGVKTIIITLDGAAYISATAITAAGNHVLTVTAVDNAQNTAIETVTFSINANTIIVVNASTAEYSDAAQLAALLTSRNSPVANQPVIFKVNSNAVGTATTGADGKAILNAVINQPAGTYPVHASFAGSNTGFLNASEGSASITVNPEKASIMYTGQYLVQFPGSITLAARVTQENDASSGDLSFARVRFDVAAINSDGTVTNVGAYTVPCNSSGEASTIQSYTIGVYSITAVIENDGYYSPASDSAVAPVYDPSGGFATGGGWINVTDPNYGNQGRANFGFNAKYKDASSTGNLEFQYKDGDINLKSKQIDWLVISAVSAQFEGVGTIKDMPGEFKFRVNCTDNNQNGNPDKFTIKIWAGLNTDTDDNLIYKALNVDLAGGNIVVKTK
jgi:hypothetical protein